MPVSGNDLALTCPDAVQRTSRCRDPHGCERVASGGFRGPVGKSVSTGVCASMCVAPPQRAEVAVPGCWLLYRRIPAGVTMEQRLLERLLAGDDEVSVADQKWTFLFYFTEEAAQRWPAPAYSGGSSDHRLRTAGGRTHFRPVPASGERDHGWAPSPPFVPRVSPYDPARMWHGPGPPSAPPVRAHPPARASCSAASSSSPELARGSPFPTGSGTVPRRNGGRAKAAGPAHAWRPTSLLALPASAAETGRSDDPWLGTFPPPCGSPTPIRCGSTPSNTRSPRSSRPP